MTLLVALLLAAPSPAHVKLKTAYERTGTPAALHAKAAATCAAFPIRSTGTTYYFCECSTGAEAGCVAGSDANAGTSPSAPKQTWAAVISTFNALGSGGTVALCKGGAWSVAAAGDGGNQFTNAACAVGSGALTNPANTTTCDLRDYQAAWGGTGKPSVRAGTTSQTRIINRFTGSTNGVRILNLEFRGLNDGPPGTSCGASCVGSGYNHVAISSGTANVAYDSDWLICNNTFTHLRIGMQPAQTGTVSNFLVWGNRFEMNNLDGILGMANGSGNRVDANVFDNNGGYMDSDWHGAHSFYITPLGNTGVGIASNMSVVNNQFLRTGATSGATPPGPCRVGVLVSHGMFNGLNIENNLIDVAPNATGGCQGIDFRAAGSDRTYYRNMTVRRNRVSPGNGLGISIGQAPGVIIEDNVITLTGSDSWKQGIWSPHDAARTSPADDVQNNTTIRNNTIYMTGGGGGQNAIYVGAEGTGHVIANNAVYSVTGTCFGTTLGRCSVGNTQCAVSNNIGDANVAGCSGTCSPDASAYTFVGNGSCYGGAAWGTTFDATTHVTANPLFWSTTDFRPRPGSPLRGAGSAARAASVDFFGRARPAAPSIGAMEP